MGRRRAQDDRESRYWAERPAWIAAGAIGLAAIAVAIALWRMGPDPPDAIPSGALEPIAIDTDRHVLEAGEARTLSANEGIWRATRVLVGLAAVQLALGVIGLIVLTRTLAAARETSTIVRSGETAYVYGLFEVTNPGNRKGGKERRIAVGVRNVGRTAALDVQVTITCVWRMGAHLEHPTLVHEHLVGPMTAGESIELYQDALHPRLIKHDPGEDDLAAFVCEITYRSVFAGEPLRVLDAKSLFVRKNSPGALARDASAPEYLIGFEALSPSFDAEDALRRARQARETPRAPDPPAAWTLEDE